MDCIPGSLIAFLVLTWYLFQQVKITSSLNYVNFLSSVFLLLEFIQFFAVLSFLKQKVEMNVKGVTHGPGPVSYTHLTLPTTPYV